MRFEAKRCLDKSGKEVVLRNTELSDTADLIRYLKATTAETPYLIREPEEITLTEEQERKFIQSKIEDERALMLLGFVDGRHVGNCSLMRAASSGTDTGVKWELPYIRCVAEEGSGESCSKQS